MTRLFRKCLPTTARHKRACIGFKWFSGQGGARAAPDYDQPLKGKHSQKGRENEAKRKQTTRLFVDWIRTHRVKLLLLERQGLSKLVSHAIKHIGSKANATAPSSKVRTHCFSAQCTNQVSGLRLRLYDFIEYKESASVAAYMDAQMEKWSETMAWVRKVAPFQNIMYLRYRDLSADPQCEMNKVKLKNLLPRQLALEQTCCWQVFRWLGVAPHSASTPMVKSVRKPLGEMLVDYERVRGELLQTQYAEEVLAGTA